MKFPLGLMKHHAMKTYCGSGGRAPRILNLDTRWRWVVSYRVLGTHCIGGWVGLRAGMDVEAKRKPLTLSGIESRSSNP